jgi:hypothetical protein
LSSSFSSKFDVLSFSIRYPKSNKILNVELVEFEEFDEFVLF